MLEPVEQGALKQFRGQTSESSRTGEVVEAELPLAEREHRSRLARHERERATKVRQRFAAASVDVGGRSRRRVDAVTAGLGGNLLPDGGLGGTPRERVGAQSLC